jgi:DNA-binding transcriptional ArsR family regulator
MVYYMPLTIYSEFGMSGAEAIEMQLYQQQARIMRALAHPVRLRILDILHQEEECVCHLTTVLEAQQPYVSKQLAILREAGLVIDRRDGLIIYYRLQDERPAQAIAAIRDMLTEQLAGAEAWPPVPPRPVSGCPCPKCEADRVR